MTSPTLTAEQALDEFQQHRRPAHRPFHSVVRTALAGVPAEDVGVSRIRFAPNAFAGRWRKRPAKRSERSTSSPRPRSAASFPATRPRAGSAPRRFRRARGRGLQAPSRVLDCSRRASADGRESRHRNTPRARRLAVAAHPGTVVGAACLIDRRAARRTSAFRASRWRPLTFRPTRQTPCRPNSWRSRPLSRGAARLPARPDRPRIQGKGPDDSAAARRQCRSCRDRPQCPRRFRSRSGPRSAHRDRSRRRRNTAHCARTAGTFTTTTCASSRLDLEAAQFRNGRDGSHARHCAQVRPHACCLVPEKRTERTTEGGLDVVDRLRN